MVLERARRIRGELEAMRVDLSLLQGLEAGHASLGVVGTASRWLVPALVGDLQQRAPGVMLRINEGASERLAAEVVSHEVTMAVVTEPIVDPRLTVEHLLEEDLVGLVPEGHPMPPEPVPFAAMAALSLILPPSGNPFRLEIDEVAAAHGLGLTVPVEVEGVRLIADLVAAGRGASILPQTAVPPGPGRPPDRDHRRDAAPPPGPGDGPPRLPVAGRPGRAGLRPPPGDHPPRGLKPAESSRRFRGICQGPRARHRGWWQRGNRTADVEGMGAEAVTLHIPLEVST